MSEREEDKPTSSEEVSSEVEEDSGSEGDDDSEFDDPEDFVDDITDEGSIYICVLAFLCSNIPRSR